jgi:hypothetical protein
MSAPNSFPSSVRLIMKRFLLAVGVALIGYGMGVAVGMVLITQLSGNQHDRSVEAAITSAFVTGPALALASFVVALVMLPRRRDQ